MPYTEVTLIEAKKLFLAVFARMLVSLTLTLPGLFLFPIFRRDYSLLTKTF